VAEHGVATAGKHGARGSIDRQERSMSDRVDARILHDQAAHLHAVLNRVRSEAEGK
jgi:hypothetical protein